MYYRFTPGYVSGKTAMYSGRVCRLILESGRDEYGKYTLEYKDGSRTLVDYYAIKRSFTEIGRITYDEGI